jgi:hypothetical protein
VTPPDPSTGPAIALETIDRLSRAHYRGMTAEELLGRLDTPLGQRQYARLLGVMLKEPFADSVQRPPSESTKAVVALRWKDDAVLKQLAPGTWQFSTMRALIDAEGTRPPLTDEQALGQLTCYKYETSLAKFVLQAFRQRICGDAAASPDDADHRRPFRGTRIHGCGIGREPDAGRLRGGRCPGHRRNCSPAYSSRGGRLLRVEPPGRGGSRGDGKIRLTAGEQSRSGSTLVLQAHSPSSARMERALAAERRDHCQAPHARPDRKRASAVEPPGRHQCRAPAAGAAEK